MTGSRNPDHISTSEFERENDDREVSDASAETGSLSSNSIHEDGTSGDSSDGAGISEADDADEHSASEDASADEQVVAALKNVDKTSQIYPNDDEPAITFDDKENVENGRETARDENFKKSFGYEKLNEVTIPYIIRDEKKFFSVRMVRKTYRHYYSIDPIKYAHVYEYVMTKPERALLDRINSKRCNDFYGKKKFTNDEGLLDYEDVQDLRDFVGICSRKLKNTTLPDDVHMGITKINNLQEIPYVLRDGVKYSPLIYFEGWEIIENNVKKGLIRVDVFEGWFLSFMKYCSAVQGSITREQFERRLLHVIKFSDVVKLLPADTTYEEFWTRNLIRHFNNDSSDFAQPSGSGMQYPMSDAESKLAADGESSSAEMMKKQHPQDKEENKDSAQEGQRKRRSDDNENGGPSKETSGNGKTARRPPVL